MSTLLMRCLREPGSLPGLSLKQWDGLLRVARGANLLSRLATRAEEAGVLAAVNPAAQPHLVAALVLSRHQREAIQWEFGHLAEALAPLGIPLVLLKGAAYAAAGRDAARGRIFGDVDLLVPRESLNAVEAALRLHGWSNGGTDPYDQRYYREWMHELPPMAHLKRGTLVDVHHNILPLTAKSVPDARLLVAASRPVAGSPWRVLAPQDMFIHSAVHLFHEGELNNGLRDLYDLQALGEEFTRNEPAYWAAMLARAHALGMAWPVALALRYLHAVLQMEVPVAVRQQALANAALGGLRLRALDAMYLRAFVPAYPDAPPPGSGVARTAVYLRSHALRMPFGMLAVHLGRKAFLRLFKNSSRQA